MTEKLDGWQSESWLKKAPIDDLQKHVDDWCEPVQELMNGLRKASPDGLMLKQALYVRDPIDKWFEMAPEGKDGGILLLGDSVHSTLPHQGQGTCQAIESGFALAIILKHWKTGDLKSALEFFQGVRKPRTDRITQTSYEAGKLASADVPVETAVGMFSPEELRQRMKWVMTYNLIEDVYVQGAEYFDLTPEEIEKALTMSKPVYTYETPTFPTGTDEKPISDMESWTRPLVHVPY